MVSPWIEMVDMLQLREALISALECRVEVQVTFHVIMDLYAIHLGPEERQRCDLALLLQLIKTEMRSTQHRAEGRYVPWFRK